MPRILSISYDATLLTTRQLLLEKEGYEVASAEGFAAALELCNGDAHFDLILMGHSIPQKDKRAIVAELRQHGCMAPVLSLLRLHEHPIPEAAYAADPSNPKQMLKTVAEALADHRAKTA